MGRSIFVELAKNVGLTAVAAGGTTIAELSFKVPVRRAARHLPGAPAIHGPKRPVASSTRSSVPATKPSLRPEHRWM